MLRPPAAAESLTVNYLLFTINYCPLPKLKVDDFIARPSAKTREMPPHLADAT